MEPLSPPSPLLVKEDADERDCDDGYLFLSGAAGKIKEGPSKIVMPFHSRVCLGVLVGMIYI